MRQDINEYLFALICVFAIIGFLAVTGGVLMLCGVYG